MIKVGDWVYILPAHSIRFANRWGEVVEIDSEHEAPIKVKFGGNKASYRFSTYEVVSAEDFCGFLKPGESILDLIKGGFHKIKEILDFKVYTNEGVFNYNEVIPVNSCRYCGKLILGDFSNICEYCKFPVPNYD